MILPVKGSPVKLPGGGVFVPPPDGQLACSASREERRCDKYGGKVRLQTRSDVSLHIHEAKPSTTLT